MELGNREALRCGWCNHLWITRKKEGEGRRCPSCHKSYDYYWRRGWYMREIDSLGVNEDCLVDCEGVGVKPASVVCAVRRIEKVSGKVFHVKSYGGKVFIKRTL